MTYADLIAWIESHFPAADYDVQVSTLRKRGVGRKETRWTAYVWTNTRTHQVQGYTAEQLRAALEAQLEAPRLVDLDLVNPEKVSA